MDFSSPSSSCLWNFPGKNTRVRCHSHLQGACLIQGSNLLSVTDRHYSKRRRMRGEGKQGGPGRRTASSTTPVSVRSGHCNKSAADWTAQQQTSVSRSLEARKSRIQEQTPNVWRCPQTAKTEAISSLRGALISFVGAHSHDPSPADNPASSITRLGI